MTNERVGPPKLIGISGKAQHGKDTLGKMLVENHGYTRFAFADPLKEMAYRIDPMISGTQSLAWLVDQMGWEEAKKIPEVRRFLQYLGHGAREVLDKGVWIRRTMRDVDAMIKEGHRVVITDMRYLNEVDAVIKRNGYVVRVNRPDAGPTGDDLSETALDGYDDWDVLFLNHSTIENLAHRVDAWISSFPTLSAQESAEPVAEG